MRKLHARRIQPPLINNKLARQTFSLLIYNTAQKTAKAEFSPCPRKACSSSSSFHPILLLLLLLLFPVELADGLAWWSLDAYFLFILPFEIEQIDIQQIHHQLSRPRHNALAQFSCLVLLNIVRPSVEKNSLALLIRCQIDFDFSSFVLRSATSKLENRWNWSVEGLRRRKKKNKTM